MNLHNPYQLLFTLLFPALLAAQSGSPAGVVKGTVRNGSKANEPLAGAEVVLYTVKNGQELDAPRPHVTTDAAGRFRFDGLQIDANFSYYPLTIFDTIKYSGELVQPDAGAPVRESDITMFETTTSDSAISAPLHHIILEPGQGKLAVREVHQFANRGTYTYFGRNPAGPETRIGLQFDLPNRAQALQVGGDLMTCCIVANQDRVFDTMEFKPGSRQAVLTYELDYEGDSAPFSKRILANTGMLDLYAPAGIRIDQVRLQRSDGRAVAATAEAEPFQIRGKNFQRYVLSDVSRGSVLAFRLSQLPAAPKDLRWIAPVALALLILGGLYLHRKHVRGGERKRPPCSEAGAEQHARAALLNEILELDEQYEAGGIEQEAYRHQRESLVQRVMALDNQPESIATHTVVEGGADESE